MRELWRLFITFCRIGGLTFGGGYAMLPMLQREVVEKYHWATESELMDYYAIGQCTPGIIAVNTATFIGHKCKGVAGGFVATLGVVFPSLVIISVIAAFLQNFSDIQWIQHAFAGIRVAVAMLVLTAVMKLWKKAIVDIPTLVIFLVTFGVMLFVNISPVYLIVLAALAGVLIKSLAARRAGQKGGRA
ncbi:MAG: chromate transporter [Christensenellales bacterium]